MIDQPKHLLTLQDLNAPEIYRLLAQAKKLKKLRGKKNHPQPLKGKTLAMIFEKSSTRTRVSFDVAMYELGGHSLTLTTQESQLGRGESYADTARVLSRYVHGMMVRTYSQDCLEELARHASVPVINGLSDLCHPVQLLADLLTLQEAKGDLSSLTVAYVGDGNNMAHSWIEAAFILGFTLRVACPKGYLPSPAYQALARKASKISILSDPQKAVEGADAVSTDTWFSMGQKVSAAKKKAFVPFQINSRLLKKAAPNAIVLHCLPAHVGEEITSEVMEGPQSRIFDEAENRLHVQKAVLVELMGDIHSSTKNRPHSS